MSRNNRMTVIAAWGAGFVAVSALSRPAEDGLARLEGAGLSSEIAVGVAHMIPVLVGALAIGVGPMILKSTPRPVRLLGLALFGAVVGFVTARFLDAFARLEALLAWVGPLREATVTDMIAWTVAGVSVVYGLLALALATFGSPAMRALAVDEPVPDPECLELRRRDRAAFAWASAGMIGQGVFLAAAALAQTAQNPALAAQAGVVLLALVGVALFAWSSGSLWGSFDEMQRRIVMDAYAWSAILVTPVLFGWVVLEGLGRVPPVSAYAILVAFILVQTVVSAVVSARAGGVGKAKFA